MDIRAKLSNITADFTPDEWPKVRDLLDFMVAEVEQANADFLELMRQNPELTAKQIEERARNPLLTH